MIVIVNNDRQQVLKKVGSSSRKARGCASSRLRVVDAVYLAVEDGPGIDGTFDEIRRDYPTSELEFCNGATARHQHASSEEIASAERNKITLVYGVGGNEKADSSSRIISALDSSGTPAGSGLRSAT